MSQFGDGSIAVSHGGIEMGQGINTKVAQTVAKELKDYGVTVDMIKVKAANTLVSPNNSVTGGSTTSELTCNVSRRYKCPSFQNTYYFFHNITVLNLPASQQTGKGNVT